ncbi:hypothetical protein DHB74_00550 [Pseudomonas sp. G11-1]|nr:hypothetical protein [Pseudomonas sp. G11-1]MCO5789058.1 hypothetical protein [Pseudomonas sp. G11-2]
MVGQLVEQSLWKVEPDDQLRWADDDSFIELVLDVPRKSKPVPLGGSSTSSTNRGAGRHPGQTKHHIRKPASPLIELVLDVPKRSKPVFPGRVEHQLDQWRRRQTSQPDQTSPMKAG